MGYCKGHFNTKRASFSNALEEQKWHGLFCLQKELLTTIQFQLQVNGCNAVRNDDLALWWGLWLLQVQFTLVLEEKL